MSETQDKVSKISQETIGKLKARSVFGLSKNPTEKGASPEKIKDAIAGVVVGNNNSLLYEINRIAGETNDGITQLNTDVDEIGNTASANSQNITKIINGTTSVAKAKNYDTTSGNIQEAFGSINSTLPNKLDKVFSDISLANELASNDYFIINSGGSAYRVPFYTLNSLLGGNGGGQGGVNHYKGDYLTLAALQEDNPMASAGDYAFVNTTTANGDKLVMYIWDNDSSSWKETTSDKYVGSTTFTTFQTNLNNGTYVVNKVKNYDTTSGNIQNAFVTINSRLDDLEYVPVEITSFTCSPSLSELGTTTTSVTFNWNFKGTPTSATIGTTTISTPSTTKTYTLSNQSITANTTFTLTLKDGRDRTVSKTCTLSFTNRIYWGVAAIPSSYTTTFVKGLTSNALATNSARTITLTLGSGQYGYFCVPATWNPTFKVGGFDGGFEDGQQITFNATDSYSPLYKIWRTTNANLGTITIEIKEGN